MIDKPNTVRTALDVLLARVSDELRKGLAAGTVVPSEVPQTRWKLVAPLQIDDNGILKGGRRSETKLEKTWAFAASAAAQAASQTEEYNAVIVLLASTFGIDLAKQHLSQFLSSMTRTILEPEGASRRTIDSLVSMFLDELSGKPVTYGAEIELQGIMLQMEHIELAEGITLRRPVTADFEREMDLDITFGSSNASAIMRIERIGLNANDIQREVTRAIAVLRLFCVASVKWICMRQFSESLFTPASWTMHNGPHEIVNHVGKINSQDRQKLESFWNRMDSCVPPDFSSNPNTESDHLAIAFERYSAALTRPGLLEEKIAQAVMALEAVLINENLELAYKLRVRAAKLLSFFGDDAIHVNRVLKDAYGVRSTFAHGDRLSYKKNKKLDDWYKPVANLLVETLDILRQVLVTAILIRKGKDHLIDMIDYALIDQQRHAALENQLRIVRQYL
ncbi:hypothetical protein [Candidatus Binatus sp.]|uniref:hypothetical protein n=3 Tax=Candidatus Binatus sp. TaxID=2811406 RepID=UPI003C9A5A61